MDREELKKDYAEQILVCERIIERNVGVIQYCKEKIKQMEKDEPAKIPQPTGEIQP